MEIWSVEGELQECRCAGMEYCRLYRRVDVEIWRELEVRCRRADVERYGALVATCSHGSTERWKSAAV